MNLTLNKEIVGHVAGLVQKDKKAAQNVAQQYLDAIDKSAMANYLLGNGQALELLTARLMSDKAVNVLSQLDELSKIVVEPAPVAPRRGRPPKSKARTAKPRGAAKVSRVDSVKAKAEIKKFIAKHPGTTRKAINAAVPLSTAQYNRIMKELKKEKVLKQAGQRAKATYSVK